MKISVIIPAYNEVHVIGSTITKVLERGGDYLQEVLVVDGGSTDATVESATKAGARVVRSPKKGRAAQMNYGAEQAQAEVFYFLHADSHPPVHFPSRIMAALDENYAAGCFRLAFDDDHFLLNAYAWFTQFDINIFRFGDQSLFISRDVFFDIEGFREDHIVMEDQEIVRRIKRSYSFDILEQSVTTSARKYRKVGIVRLQLIFALILVLYYAGADQQTLIAIYNDMVR